MDLPVSSFVSYLSLFTMKSVDFAVGTYGFHLLWRIYEDSET